MRPITRPLQYLRGLMGAVLFDTGVASQPDTALPFASIATFQPKLSEPTANHRSCAHVT